MPRSEIRPLTGIRGVAAIAVLFHHFGEKMEAIFPPLAVVAPIRGHGNLGVDLFFILSGFIMTYVYSQHLRNFSVEDYRKFIVKRFARLYPNHLTALLLLLGIWTVARAAGITMQGNYSFRDFFMQAFLLNGFLPNRAWNYPNWSVSIEWFAYLAIFPASIPISRLHLVRRFPFIVGISLTILYVFTYLHVPAWSAKTYQIILQFLAGVFIFMAWEGRKQSAQLRLPVADIVAATVIVVFASSYFALLDYFQVTYILICCCPLLIYGLANQTGILSRWLGTRVWVYLGTISYALYITHAVVEKVLKVAAPVEKCAGLPLPARMVIVLLHLVIPIVFAAVIYHFIEEPGRRALCDRLLNKKAKTITS